MGYEFRGFGGQIRVSRKKLAAFKQRATEILRRNRGISMQTRLAELRTGLAWVFRTASSEGNVPGLRQVASATRTVLLFETVAEVENSAEETD